MDDATAHARYLAHVQHQLNEAHAWQVKCYAVGGAGAASKPAAEPEAAALPRSLAMAPAVDYLRVAWGAKGGKTKLADRIRGAAEVASRGKLRVPVIGPGYAGGAGTKPVLFDRYSLESLDAIGASLAGA